MGLAPDSFLEIRGQTMYGLRAALSLAKARQQAVHRPDELSFKIGTNTSRNFRLHVAMNSAMRG